MRLLAMTGFALRIRRHRDRRVVLASALIVLLASCCGGCGRLVSSGYSVSGNVTWNGKPLDQGTIQFLPASGQGAMVGAEIQDGKYALPNPPGLVAGTYRVRINSLSGAGAGPADIPDAHLGDPNVKERIPAQYNEKTTLEAEVGSGGSTFDFNLTGKAAAVLSDRASR